MPAARPGAALDCMLGGGLPLRLLEPEGDIMLAVEEAATAALAALPCVPLGVGTKR